MRDLIQRLDAFRRQDDAPQDAALAALLAELAQALEAGYGTPSAATWQAYHPDFFDTDLAGNLLNVSRGLAALFADDPATLIGRSILDLLNPDTRAALGERLRTLQNSGPLQIWELDLQTAGEAALQFVTIVHLFDADHDAPWVRWQVFDLAGTETSGVVCELNCLRSSLLDGLPGIAYRCLNEPDYTMIYISEGCRNLTGYAPEDLLGNKKLTFADLIVEEDRARIWKGIQAAAKSHTAYHLAYRIRTVDGQVKHVWEQGRATTNTYHGIPLLEGFITDVTAQAKIEIALAQRTEEVSLLYEASTQLNQTLDPDSLFETLRDIISRRLDCQGLIIADYDPKTELITCAFGWGQDGRIDVSKFPPLPLNNQGAGTQSIVIRSAKPLYLPDLAAQARTANTRFEVAELRPPHPPGGWRGAARGRAAFRPDLPPQTRRPGGGHAPGL